MVTSFSLAARLGFWSAVVATGASLAFSVASVPVLLGAVTPPWADVLTLVPSLVLAPALLVVLVCVQETAPADTKIWGHLAVVFSGIYVALVCTVYTVALSVVEPLIVSGQAAQAGLLSIDPGGVLNAIDGLGYTFLCLATLCAAPLFSGDRLRRSIRWLLIANAAAAVPILLTYFVDRAFIVLAGPVWTMAICGAAVSLAVFFRRLGSSSHH
jgi:hypothetical protein